MSFPNTIHGVESETHNTYAIADHRLAPAGGVGQSMVIEDGRLYRFAENAGVALVTGKCTQMEVPTTDTAAEAVGTMVAGDTVLTGVGSTANDQAAELLIDGYVWSITATDLNPAMRIKNNTLISNGAETGTIALYNPLVSAIDAADTITYIKNMWKDVIITLAPNTAPLTGVPPVAVTVGYHCWLQTRGICRVLVEDTPVIAEETMIGEDDGGAVDSAPDSGASASIDMQPVGVCIDIGSDQAYGCFFLVIE